MNWGNFVSQAYVNAGWLEFNLSQILKGRGKMVNTESALNPVNSNEALSLAWRGMVRELLGRRRVGSKKPKSTNRRKLNQQVSPPNYASLFNALQHASQQLP